METIDVGQNNPGVGMCGRTGATTSLSESAPGGQEPNPRQETLWGWTRDSGRMTAGGLSVLQPTTDSYSYAGGIVKSPYAWSSSDAPDGCKYFMDMLLFNLHEPYVVGFILTSDLQVRKLRCGEAKCLVYSHTQQVALALEPPALWSLCF